MIWDAETATIQEMNTSSAQPTLSAPPPESRARLVYRIAKRILALAVSVITIYTVIGSCMFPYWWFELLWGGEFNREYIDEGIKALFETSFALVMGIIVAAFAAFILGTIFKARLFRFLDKWSGYVVVTATFILITTALVLYHIQQPPYQIRLAALLNQGMAEFTQTQLSLIRRVPRVSAPVDFHFLDKNRVDALYNQIEPELVETERTATHANTAKGKIGLVTGPATAEVEADKSQSLTSSLKRPDFNSERKCLEVMNYIVEHRGPGYYTTFDEAIERKANAASILEAEAQRLTGAPVDSSTIRLIRPLDQPQTDDERRETQRKRAKYDDELKQELKSLRGFLFIEGDFVQTVSGDTITLVEYFSAEPPKIFFRVTLAKHSVSDLLDKPKLHLTVFGDVIRPLDKNGNVDIQGIAIY